MVCVWYRNIQLSSEVCTTAGFPECSGASLLHGIHLFLPISRSVVGNLINIVKRFRTNHTSALPTDAVATTLHPLRD